MLFRELRDALPDLEGLHLKKRAQDEETEYLLEGLVVCKKKTQKTKNCQQIWVKRWKNSLLIFVKLETLEILQM